MLSVDESTHTALVRSKSIKYTAPTAANATEAAWLTALNTAMSTVEKPEGAIGDWRIPTLAEVEIFATNPALNNGNSSSPFFCMNGNVLEFAFGSHLDTTPVLEHSTNYDSTVKFRAVINISY